MPLSVLDSDHSSLILRGHPQVIDRLQALESSQWAITIVSIQASFNGWIVNLNDPRYHDRQVELYTRLWQSNQFFQKAHVLNFDGAAQKCYSLLRSTAPNLNKRRLEKDVKITAIALINQGWVIAIAETQHQSLFCWVSQSTATQKQATTQPTTGQEFQEFCQPLRVVVMKLQ